MDEKHIKYLMEVKVDGLRGINTYTIKEAYDKAEDDGNDYKYYSYNERVINEFTMTWEEIEKSGGVGKVNAQLRERYNIKNK